MMRPLASSASVPSGWKLATRGACFLTDLVAASGLEKEAAEEGLWELLAQKSALEDVDVELLNLLGAQGAIALEAARLHAAAGEGS